MNQEVTAEQVGQYITNPNIKTGAIRHHTKASESYIDVTYNYQNGLRWEGSLPYQYRRTGKFLEDPKLIAEYVEGSYALLRPEHTKKWVDRERKYWEEHNGGRLVTKEFFDKLLNLNWNCIEHDFPANPNWARRIQDIKEMGYTLATNTRLWCKKGQKNSTHIMLVPIDKTPQMGYEYISPRLRERVIKLLNGYDAFESSNRAARYLIPDHKFPEISWDADTRKENLDDLTDEEIKHKFQLLDNQRNLQKREACRQIFQTGKRGTIFGIKFYYQGDENWPHDIPKVGAKAEQGWVGSPWYDIERWRQELNSKLEAVSQLEQRLGHSIEEELKKLKSSGS
jgi:hypothetical protein